MMELSDLSFACISLDSSTCADIVCGSNGLPLTPNSIRIIGDFKAHVEHVEHPNLTKYVECSRNKNERVTLVFENLTTQRPNSIDILKVTNQLLDALNFLHNTINCVHGLLTPESLVWSNGTLKLTNWPLNLLTNGGLALGASTLLPSDVSFIAPEQVKNPNKQATTKSDIWSAGLSLLKLLKPTCKLPENPCRLAFCDNVDQVLQHIDGLLDESIVQESSKWNEFFRLILNPLPEQRASLAELYSFLGLIQPPDSSKIRFEPLDSDRFKSEQAKITNLNLSEIYYLWRLSLGRNFESEQKQDDCPPIFKIPYLIIAEKPLIPSTDHLKLKDHTIINSRPKLIPLDKFKSDIRCLSERIFNPLILTDEEAMLSEETRSRTAIHGKISSKECNNNRKSSEPFTFADLDSLSLVSQNEIRMQARESSKVLPIVIKEADFSYQCERIVLFKRLLSGCPFLKDKLKREASIDIPPYFRAKTWAILLDVCPQRSKQLYESIDKTTPVATDRQISVDIPRCHQYNELMASPQGHQKLARILKAWLNYNSAEYVYWQGLDSLAAPFLLLNFDSEHIAFACFNAFVNKYLKGFFRKDNQLIVQQYLSMFSELLSYHDPSLAIHLEKLGFLPNLYAIPWFLTMFTHVLPLHKILHVWDCLLLGDEKFPLCIGLAILNQLKQELMDFSFNDCIVAFSDMPEIDIERCIRDASQFYNTTPDKLINLSGMNEFRDGLD